VDITLILHEIFLATITMDPPRELTEELVFDTLDGYKDSDRARDIHRLVYEIADKKSLRPEEDFVALIKKQLRME
jgi:hypothetical protein